MVVERPLFGYLRFSFDVNGSNTALLEALRENFVRFLDLCLNGEPQYIRLEGSARSGTIGRVALSTLLSRQDHQRVLNGELNPRNAEAIKNGFFSRNASGALGLNTSYEAYLLYMTNHFEEFLTIEVSNGKFIKPAGFTEYKENRSFTWLEGYTGPTVDVMVRKPKNSIKQSALKAQAEVVDRLGKNVQVGDFVIASVKNQMFPAVVTRFSSSGKSIYVRNTLVEGDEFLAYDFFIIDDKIKTRAMMAKLAK